jgi:hypothetical protein
MTLLFGAWTLPGVRVARFWLDARQVYQEEQSINAWNDVKYAVWLAGAYAICAAIPALLLAIRGTSRYRGVLIVAASFLIAADVFLTHPAEVIFLFPSMSPLQPVCCTALAGAIVLLLPFEKPPKNGGRTAIRIT